MRVNYSKKFIDKALLLIYLTLIYEEIFILTRLDQLTWKYPAISSYFL